MTALNGNKLLLTGSAGLLGEALIDKLCGRFSLIAVYNNNPPVSKCEGYIKYQADLADEAQAEDAVDKLKPDIIVNSAAWVDVDGCESDRERAWKSNYKVVENLVNSTCQKGTYLIQISTDYIFNGKDHPGRIDDRPDPLNYYGQTKLMAEEYIRRNHPNYLIVRTCALMADPKRGKTNLLNYFYDNLKAGRQVVAPDDIYANPIWIHNLAELIAEALERHLTGILHMGGMDHISRYEFGKILADVFGFDKELVKPVSADRQRRPAKRPQYAGLDMEQSKGIFKTEILPVRKALMKIKRVIK